MTLAQRRALGPVREDSQVLLGEQVKVLSVRGSWANVFIATQASTQDPKGYPGWIPLRQLSARTPPATRMVATVTAKTAELRTAKGASAMNVSYATRLPFVGHAGSFVKVWVPDGRTLKVAAKNVVVADRDAPALPRTAEAIIEDARRFLGLPYLWGGNSAYGFDCSGIIYQVFRTHGILVPRDSAVQAGAGRAVARSYLRPGDLVFFATKGVVHHVGLYVGDGKMLEAPGTGEVVRITNLSDAPYDEEYSGGRRVL